MQSKVKLSPSSRFKDALRCHLDAHPPVNLLFIETREMERTLALVETICREKKLSKEVRDLVEYYAEVVKTGTLIPGFLTSRLIDFLDEGNPNPKVLIIPELWDQFQMDASLSVEKLSRELVIWLSEVDRTLRQQNKILVILGGPILNSQDGEEAPRVPPRLQSVSAHLVQPLPDLEELSNLAREFRDRNGHDLTWELDDTNGVEMIASSLQGLSISQARSALESAINGHGGPNREIDRNVNKALTEAKGAILRQTDALEFFPAWRIQNEEIGGLDALTAWLKEREDIFTQEARDFGLPPLKGILLVGIPGTGKSLSAKLAAKTWGIPLVRLDMGALFGAFVGESEGRTRRALATVDAISPCVLWLDEIEKGLEVGGGGGDGGTSQRVFGTILTWMQEKQSQVFIVATANKIANLPPELKRKGRFDEMFFLDLPNPLERLKIFEVQLRKHGRPNADLDLPELVRNTEGWVGSEIEQILIDGMYMAFNRKPRSRKLLQADLLTLIARSEPLSKSEATQKDILEITTLGKGIKPASMPFLPDGKHNLGER